MKRRIYLNFIRLILPCVVILTVVLSVLFQNAAINREFGAVRENARLMADLLNSGIVGEIEFSDHISVAPDRPRLTVIAPNGAVLLDSMINVELMENHSDRPEVISALETGTGEDRRYSATTGLNTYYYTILLNDGNVLRLAHMVSGLAAVVAIAAPSAAVAVIAVLLLANIAARKVSARIIQPLSSIDLNTIDLNTVEYEELEPFVEKIERQKHEIDEKIAALRERTLAIEAITGNMREGLILIGKDGTILMANDAVRELFGEIAGQIAIVHICREEDFQHGVRECLGGKSVETRLERGGKHYSVFLNPVWADGAVSGAVIFFIDVTQRREAERQRREFSANVSHELKTPLTTISALSEMIESGMAKADDVSSFAGRINEQSGRLLDVINDIIRLSEFDEGGIAKEFTTFDMWELTEEVINALNGSLGDIEVRITGEHIDVTANRRMIDELLYNLIDNGIKYNKAGGSVTVDFEREDGYCKITVSDTGMGIAPEHHARVFERFYRADHSRSKKTGGTGLGLAIVKHITEHHVGRCELASVEGEGTTVTCWVAGLAVGS